MTPVERVRSFLSSKGFTGKVYEIDKNTANSQLAANALGVEVAEIAKSILFLLGDKPVVVVTCGDRKVQSGALKSMYGKKPKMAPPDKVLELTGYPVGGVCPFDLNGEIDILIDRSMQEYPVVYAAAGTPSSLVPITFEELLRVTEGTEVSVCK